MLNLGKWPGVDEWGIRQKNEGEVLGKSQENGNTHFQPEAFPTGAVLGLTHKSLCSLQLQSEHFYPVQTIF